MIGDGILPSDMPNDQHVCVMQQRRIHRQEHATNDYHCSHDTCHGQWIGANWSDCECFEIFHCWDLSAHIEVSIDMQMLTDKFVSLITQLNKHLIASLPAALRTQRSLLEDT